MSWRQGYAPQNEFADLQSLVQKLFSSFYSILFPLVLRWEPTFYFKLACFKCLMNYTSCTYIHYICLLHNYCKIISPQNIIQFQSGKLPHLAWSMFLRSSLHFPPKAHKWFANLPKDSLGREVYKNHSQKEIEMGRVMHFKNALCTCSRGEKRCLTTATFVQWEL